MVFIKNRWYNVIIGPLVYVFCFIASVWSALVTLLTAVALLLSPKLRDYVGYPDEPRYEKKDPSASRILFSFVRMQLFSDGWARGVESLLQFDNCFEDDPGRARNSSWLRKYARWTISLFFYDLTKGAHKRAIHALRAIYGFQTNPRVDLATAWYVYRMTEWCTATWSRLYLTDYASLEYFFDGPLPEGWSWADDDLL